jgi:DNA polymerase I-like protein with 3'-5' exonuclease and polymerase domains
MRSVPEIRIYHDNVGRITEGGNGRIGQLRSGRVRGGLGFTDCANGFFQGLAADGAKHALFRVSKACYTDRSSPLYGCRPANFVHDENILEAPKEQAHEAALEMTRIMCETMHEGYCPNVPIEASPALMERWYKSADAVYDSVTKRLIPWRPK